MMHPPGMDDNGGRICQSEQVCLELAPESGHGLLVSNKPVPINWSCISKTTPAYHL